MGSIFSPDGPFNTFMTLVFDIMILSILWILCCVPVITIGASTTALYTVMLKRADNEEGYVIRGFFKAFKSNFRQTLPLTLIMLLIGAVLFVDFYIVSTWQFAAGSVMYALCLVALFFFAGIFSYVWPLTATFENTRIQTLNNALRLTLGKLPWTLLLVLLNGLPVFTMLFLPGVFARILFLWILIGGGLTAYLASRILNPIFKSIIGSEG